MVGVQFNTIIEVKNDLEKEKVIEEISSRTRKSNVTTVNKIISNKRKLKNEKIESFNPDKVRAWF